MQTFTIITSRGSTTTLELDDPALDMTAALDAASAIYRHPIGKGWTHYAEGIYIGTYLNDGQEVRIAVIETTTGSSAEAKYAARAATWVGAINL